MTDPGTTVLDGMLAAGISRDRALEHLRAGAVRVGGVVVTDPEGSAPWGVPWVVNPQ